MTKFVTDLQTDMASAIKVLIYVASLFLHCGFYEYFLLPHFFQGKLRTFCLQRLCNWVCASYLMNAGNPHPQHLHTPLQAACKTDDIPGDCNSATVKVTALAPGDSRRKLLVAVNSVRAG